MRSENKQVLVKDLQWKEPRDEKVIFFQISFQWRDNGDKCVM